MFLTNLNMGLYDEWPKLPSIWLLLSVHNFVVKCFTTIFLPNLCIHYFYQYPRRLVQCTVFKMAAKIVYDHTISFVDTIIQSFVPSFIYDLPAPVFQTGSNNLDLIFKVTWVSPYILPPGHPGKPTTGYFHPRGESCPRGQDKLLHRHFEMSKIGFSCIIF